MTRLHAVRPSASVARMLIACAVGATALVSGDARAAPCAGFTDIDDTHVFCPSVDWLKNRAITLGCTSTTLFCPTASVTRLQMAAFMNRLGTALTPHVIHEQQAGASLDLDTPPSTPLCVTVGQMFAAGAFPRRAGVSGVLTARAGAAVANVDVRLVHSVNGGAWTPVTTHPSSTGAAASQWMNVVAHSLDTPLTPGSSYAFGLAVNRSSSPASSGDLTTWNCQVEVVIYSRTGGASPF